MHDVVERARRNGPLPYSALGRSREEPTAGGEGWLAATLDRCWDALGHPDPYLVVEVGTACGVRATRVIASGPRCQRALRYVLVDDPPLTAVPGLLLEAPALALGPVIPEHDDEPPEPVRGVGPLVTALGELPQVGGVGLVVTIGWLSGAPADRYERTDHGWAEIRVAATVEGGLAELSVPADVGTAEALDRLVADRVGSGERIAVARGARDWLRQALGSLDAGRIVVVDTFVRFTGPVGDGPPPLALDQLASLRQPVQPPAEAFSQLQSVEWEAHR